MKELKELEKQLKEKNQPKNSVKTKEEFSLLEFKRRLNQAPPESILRSNPEYGNKYIPLQFVEVMLDILFTSKQFVMRHKPDFVEGQTVFYMDVVVVHPVTKEVLTYSGTSVVGTMPNSDNYRDVHKRIPAGESFAILNAVQKIGRIFRPQQEKFISALDTYFEKETKEEKRSEMYDRLKRMIDELDYKDPLNIVKAKRWVDNAGRGKKISSEEFEILENHVLFKNQ